MPQGGLVEEAASEAQSSARWALVAYCAIGLAVSIGPIFVSTFSTFIIPLQRDLGWSRGELSTLFTVQGVALVVATFFLARIVERFGAHIVIGASAILLAIAMAGLATAPSIYFVFILWVALIGACGSGTNSFVYLTILPQRFPRRLGLVFGLAMTGVGLGQLTMPILAQHLQAAAGWRSAYLVLAAIMLAVSLPVAWLLKERPQAGLSRVQSQIFSESPGLTLPQALRSPSFWLLWVSFFLLSVASGGVLIHLAPLLIDRGADAGQAAAVVGLSGIAVLIFRLVGGYMLDRVGSRLVGTAAFIASALAPIALFPSIDIRFAALAPLLVGLATGVEGDVMPFVSRQCFGLRSYASIYGRIFLSMMSGPLVGAAVAGFLFDHTGDYTFGLWLFCGMSLIALPLYLLGIERKPLVL